MDLDNVGDADLYDDGYGTWDPVPGAHHYELRLYRNDKTFGSGKRTEDTSYDFSSMITRRGRVLFPGAGRERQLRRQGGVGGIQLLLF